MVDFFLGARGWDHPAWQGSLYPDDLPPEWRLSYYANEFNAVLAPADLWGAADAGLIASWADDVHDDFRFFLELPAGAETAITERIPEVAAGLGAACGGLVLTGHEQSVGLTGVARSLPLYLSMTDPVAPHAEGFRLYPATGAAADAPHILLVTGLSALTLAAMRDMISGMDGAGLQASPRGVFFAGEGLSASKMQQVRVMAELMGIA